MDTPKKKILFHSDMALSVTGFGKNARNILEYLYKTDKYQIVHFCVGAVEGNQDLDRTPWKSIGAVNHQKLQEIKQSHDPRAWESLERIAGYGDYTLDDVVRREKPDVYIAAQDIWGIMAGIDKPWFNKITSVLWTTLDSLPILPKAIEAAAKCKNYWVWSDFARKELHRLGHTHVKTLGSALKVETFYRLPDSDRANLRKSQNISESSFIIGYVFRNQLRKSVPNLLQGFKLFKKDCPQAKLLLVTSWVEGWSIPRFMEEFSINPNDVLTVYICPNCQNYDVKPHTGQHTNCRHCGIQGSQPTQQNPQGQGMVTVHPVLGVSEKQLNEIYNLMDVSVSVHTSGGFEIPIAESKLVELITLVTNYSCGEDHCVEGAYSLPLDWSEYREPGDTQFIKASTYPSSIAKQLNRVFQMKPDARREWGKKARNWVIENFSTQVIGKKLEDFIDNTPFISKTDPNIFEKVFAPREPNLEIPFIQDNEQWLNFMYTNILKMDKDENGLRYWLGELQRGIDRRNIEAFFRQQAEKENQGQTKVNFEDLLDKKDKGRVIYVLPQSAGDLFLSTALFKSIKNRYPEWTFYVATMKEYKSIIDGNPYVDKWLEYRPEMDNALWLEGSAHNKGFFDVAYTQHCYTQKMISPSRNGLDKLDFPIHY